MMQKVGTLKWILTCLVLADVEFELTKRSVRSRATGICIFYHFLYTFTGFAIDRSKKYIKIIEIYMKIDADDPQAAADNPPQPPVTMVRCPAPYNPPKPPKPRQIVRCLRMLTHARSYCNLAAAGGGGLT